jgi:REP element-mobilizing transposase RayT
MGRARKGRQLEIRFPPGRGGKRKGSGRKPNGAKALVWHVRRPEHVGRHPVHVTLKIRRDVPRLRRKRLLSACRLAFEAGRDRFGFRLVHFSVQDDHIHMICEASDKRALSRGLQGLNVRLAKGINKKLGRRGKVLADRYHLRALATPTEVRNALRYVLANDAHHAAQRTGRHSRSNAVDPFSSALDFDGWTCRVRSNLEWRYSKPATAPPSTWLLRVGWLRAGGKLDPRAGPGAAAER